MDLRALPVASTLGNALEQFAHACKTADNASPFNDASMLAPQSRHALAIRSSSNELVALALCAPAGDNDAYEVEFAVHPDHRERGYGRRLYDQLVAMAPAPLRFWAHGNTAGAQALAASVGIRPMRTLYVLTRSTAPTDATPGPTPEGYCVRAFDESQDAVAWVSLNATVFADHPEQGKLTLDDLQARMSQPWFCAEDFFVVTPEDAPERLLGYCWCKVTEDAAEVYVLGIHPDAAGHGLGGALMRRAFARFAELGRSKSELYVDGDNHSALGLYRKLGYEEHFSDVQYG